MAKQIAFAVFDEKAESYAGPFTYPAVGQMVRTFTEWCNDAEHPIGRHPHDYTLFRIGSYDDATAALSGESPVKLLSGSECVQALAVAR